MFHKYHNQTTEDAPIVSHTACIKYGLSIYLFQEKNFLKFENVHFCSMSSLRFYMHIHSLGITLETFHFPETVQVLSNPTAITLSHINPQQNKNQTHSVHPLPPIKFSIRGGGGLTGLTGPQYLQGSCWERGGLFSGGGGAIFTTKIN